MMRMRRQSPFGEIDAPAIEEFAGGSNRDEHRLIAMFDNADAGGSLRSWSPQVNFPFISNVEPALRPELVQAVLDC